MICKHRFLVYENATIMILRRFTLGSYPKARHFSSRRAVIYSSTGDPAQVLSISRVSPLSESVPTGHIGVKLLLSPINPADLNVVQGVYPSKPVIRDDLGTPSPAFIGGNEGLGQVEKLGDGVTELSVGDWVVMTKPQSGTWASHAYVESKDVTKVDKRVGEARASMITVCVFVNPPTAHGMLSDFRALEEGDYVIQNGANSAVGQAVIQIAAARKLKTINVVRDRPNIDELKQYLTSLGATHVITEQELSNESMRIKLKEWTQSKGIKLGLNCVGGKPTTILAKQLGPNAALVSYGAMSKAPLSLYETHTSEERQSMLQEITELMLADKLKAPEHEILTIPDSDEGATHLLREKLKQIDAGRYGKKLLLKFA
ncbi:trans-2-enoyl-CoA reductase [Rhizoctonia solani AG-1 IA]|uniref:enoyl-[acyl-carrier-protein] reductase n=1 Tax=Thanatephorus cucumeris (strain AG1-IA) TaxID=983506 RepID=L8X397_THACA|nr:trans-2-enoyl-CoA reductase [Rhizoctonia solani AG-1 IA]